jgi:hypothetical protein
MAGLSRIAEYCLGEVPSQELNSVVLSISIFGNYSVQPPSQNDVQTSDLNHISFQRARYESTSATPGCRSALSSSDISKTISFFIHRSKRMYLI